MPTVEKVVRNELLLKQARERSRLALAAAREALAAGDDPSDQEADYRAAERDVVILENRSAQLQARAKG